MGARCESSTPRARDQRSSAPRAIAPRPEPFSSQPSISSVANAALICALDREGSAARSRANSNHRSRPAPRASRSIEAIASIAQPNTSCCGRSGARGAWSRGVAPRGRLLATTHHGRLHTRVSQTRTPYVSLRDHELRASGSDQLQRAARALIACFIRQRGEVACRARGAACAVSIVPPRDPARSTSTPWDSAAINLLRRAK